MDATFWRDGHRQLQFQWMLLSNSNSAIDLSRLDQEAEATWCSGLDGAVRVSDEEAHTSMAIS